MVALFLVRHGVAVGRSKWADDDALRPLSDKGTQQAHLLARSFGGGADVRILASPARRCIDTISPLARRIGAPVDVDPRLAEGEGMAVLETLRTELAAGPARSVVACTHGDVLAALLNAFSYEDGLVLPDQVRWDEASTWVIEMDGNRRATTAAYRPVNDAPTADGVKVNNA